jgi:hypothetical protein
MAWSCRWLLKDKDLEIALPAFLNQHAWMHAARLTGASPSYQDEVLRGLTEAQLRRVPPGGVHSIAWLLWHLTRIEDVTMNLLLAGSSQVLHRGRWPGKLGVTTESVGNEMSAAEIAALSAALNMKALLAYRLAVGRRTRTVARHLNPQTLWQPPASDRLQRAVDEGAVGEQAA